MPNKDRKDSQGICFLGKLKFNDFINHYLGQQPGDIIEFETGKRLGEHKGFWYHTIGQRRGSGLAHGPWYVVAKDTQKNRVYMSREYHTTEKSRDFFVAVQCNWIAGMSPSKKNIQVKLRHGASMYDAIVDVVGSTVAVKLAQHDQGIAPGQFAVFYDDQVCLGAGIIHEKI